MAVTGYEITKDFYEKTTQKIAYFRGMYPKKQIVYTFITNQKIIPNQYSTALIGQTITLEDLF